jgi:hypothetical protein
MTEKKLALLLLTVLLLAGCAGMSGRQNIAHAGAGQYQKLECSKFDQPASIDGQDGAVQGLRCKRPTGTSWNKNSN